MMAASGFPAAFESRRPQMFPAFSLAEIARLRRYGELRRCRRGEKLFRTGERGTGLFVVLAGTLLITARDGHGQDVAITEHGVGQFSGEVGQLAGKPSFVDGTASSDLEGLLISPPQLRAMLVAEAEIGEKVMRALILRRVALIETGAGGPVLIGNPSSPDVVRLRGFLSRNGWPHQVFDPEVEPDARECVLAVAGPSELPIVACPNGEVLRNPTEEQLARCLGMTDAGGDETLYDVAIAGAGPAGLATAVYAASEGLSVLVIDARAFGGQAGASARIENYLGFPTGISGQALSGRAFTQAQKFGARMLIPARIERLECDRCDGSESLHLRLEGNGIVRARTLVIATGALYRRPAIANLQTFEGHGISYWATGIEARMCEGEEVVLVGGGNSAGQAAVFLSQYAKKVWMLVRGDGLASSMSRYLIDRIAAAANIELVTRTEIVRLDGTSDAGLRSVRWRNRDSGSEHEAGIRHVFLFAGADPATEWLADCGIALDDKGFVKTGCCPSRPGSNLETSVPGVFAAGDVRSGSVKRVGGAIGEGAAVVGQIHAFLAG